MFGPVNLKTRHQAPSVHLGFSLFLTKIGRMKLPGNWYLDWFNSPYYHQLYFQRNEEEAASFIGNLLQHFQPRVGSKMLDVACGRGRHARVLSAAGYDVTGFDVAPDSVKYAKQFEGENLHFYQHDMRLPFWSNYFDFAFNFFTSFGYFRTEREHYSALRTISRSLKNGSLFLMDYLNVHYAEDHLVHKSQKDFDHVTYYLIKWFDETHFFKRIIIEDDRRSTPLEFTERVAKFSLGDFSEMFAYCGLQLKEVFGDYQLGPYDHRNSPRLIMAAAKGH